MSALIKPQEGKKYLTRGGWITPRLEKHHAPFYADRGYQKHGKDITVHWDVEGNGWGTDGIINDYDLVAEYVDETTPQDILMIRGKMYKMIDTETYKLVATYTYAPAQVEDNK